MANISSFLNKIRNAVYGKEVRGSLADGLEAVNKETENATDLSKNTERRQTSVEQQFDDLQQNATDISPSDIEIVAARTNNETGESYPTLVKRLNDENKKVTEQLADKAELKVFERIPTPSQLKGNELGLVLLPEVPFNYDFNGTSGLKWDEQKFENINYEASTGLMNASKTYSELKDNSGLIKVSKGASQGLVTSENKVIKEIDLSSGNSYRIQFDVKRSIVEGDNKGNCGISISPHKDLSSYYPFNYLLTDGISLLFGFSGSNNNVNFNFRKIKGSAQIKNEYVARNGGFTTSAASYLYIDEGEIISVELILSRGRIELKLKGKSYLNVAEDLSVLSANNTLCLWGALHNENAQEAEHFFDNLIIEEVV